jgi:hypothetical protein
MDYYVYVYIDPRNHEEFYYGKGRGSRKNAHLESEADTEKTKRIAAIRKAGLEPIIRVVARGLTEHEALLVEKTLLHKLGKTLTNISSGHYADKFRPHDTLHIELSGFDYKSGVYYFNLGQGEHRQWADCRKYGFISAGQGPQWARAICGFNVGDVFAAYLKGEGFVGIGQITEKARPIREVRINGRPLISLPLECKKMNDNIDSDEKCEYVALVKWIRSVPEEEAKLKRRSGIYTTTHIRASLDNQPETRSYLEEAFGVSFSELAR